MIPSMAIRLGLSFVASLGVGRLLIKNKELRKLPETYLSNSIFVYLVTLKLSLLLTNFNAVQNEIMYLVYAWGSGINQAVAVMATLAYYAWFIVDKSENKKNDSVFIGGSIGVFVAFFFASSFFISDLEEDKSVALAVFENKVDIYEKPIATIKGRALILNFWATWCPPCRAEMPDLNAFVLNNANANFVSINNISSEKNGLEGVKEFMETNNYSFEVMADYNNELTKLFNISSFPTTVVVSPTGNVIAKKVGVVSEGWLKQWIP